MFFVGGLVRLPEDVVFFEFCLSFCEVWEAFVYLYDLDALDLRLLLVIAIGLDGL